MENNIVINKDAYIKQKFCGIINFDGVNSATETLCVGALNNNIVHILDKELLDYSKITTKNIIIVLNDSILSIDLKDCIQKSIYDLDSVLVEYLLDKQVGVLEYEPNLLMKCVAAGNNRLLHILIGKNYDISGDDYALLSFLVERGENDTITAILDRYNIPNVARVVGKMCAKACIMNNVGILKMFMDASAFEGAPDRMYEYFLLSIKYGKGANLDVIKFFVENGVNVGRDSGAAIALARTYYPIYAYLTNFFNI